MRLHLQNCQHLQFNNILIYIPIRSGKTKRRYPPLEHYYLIFFNIHGRYKSHKLL